MSFCRNQNVYRKRVIACGAIEKPTAWERAFQRHPKRQKRHSRSRLNAQFYVKRILLCVRLTCIYFCFFGRPYMWICIRKAISEKKCIWCWVVRPPRGCTEMRDVPLLHALREHQHLRGNPLNEIQHRQLRTTGLAESVTRFRITAQGKASLW